MAFCTECGSKLSDDAVFCPNCGSPVTPAGTKTANEIAPEEIKATDAAIPESPRVDSNANLDSTQFQQSGVYNEPPANPAQAPTAGAYIPPTSGGYAPPPPAPPYQGGYTPPPPPPQNQYYAPNAYGYPPYAGAAAQSPKKSGGKTALIVISAVVVVLIIAAVLLFKSCGSNPYVGYWESTAVDVGDGQLSEYFYDQYIVGALSTQINSDGTVFLASSTSTDVYEGQWEETKDGLVVTTDENTYTFGRSDDRLTLEEEGVTYYFEQVEGDINNPTIPRDTTVSDNSDASYGVAGSGYVGDGSYYISVIGAEDFTDVDGDPAIRIYYEFTNDYYDHFSLSVWDALSYYATQDGSYLTETYPMDASISSNSSYNIRPGVTIQSCVEFKYDPNGGSVDLNIYGYEEGEGAGVVTASYVPGSLPGAPAPYVIVPVSDPQWTTNIPGDGTLDNVYVSVLDAELITDSSGYPALRVYYEFTNNNTYSTSFSNEVYNYAYQDGISLDYTYATEDSSTDADYYTEIAPGSTITISCIFSLRNQTSPVEAEVESYSGYDAVGQTYSLVD